MDFTLFGYKQLLLALQSQGFLFQNFEEYIQNSRYRQLVYWLNGRMVKNVHTISMLTTDDVRVSNYGAVQ